MAIRVGDRIPSVTFKWMGSESPIDVRSSTTDEVFRGKTVAVFGLPGAYTPVCSEEHLPGFVRHAEELKAKGIDAITCISVNDPFVMQAWAQELNVSNDVMMLCDPKVEFTNAVGLCLDLSDFGLGDRSERYSMLVEDGVVKALNVEESILSCEMSSAEALLEQVEACV
ncbi:MAG: redoxin family protein [Gammaproteobacteria bacterium]|nr:MAG: redoxin family protein [Gammaproteobacteria bacterium]